jgi:hypothetical protein
MTARSRGASRLEHGAKAKPGLVQLAPHRALAHAEDAGDLHAFDALELAECEGQAKIFRERAEAGLQARDELSSGGVVIRAFARRERRLGRGRRVERPPTELTADVVPHDVQGDPEDPAADGRALAIALGGPIDLDEGRLNEVLDIAAIDAGLTPEDPMNAVGVPIEELGQRVSLANRARRHERLVGQLRVSARGFAKRQQLAGRPERHGEITHATPA